MAYDSLKVDEEQLSDTRFIPIKIHGVKLAVQKSKEHFSSVNILGADYMSKADLRGTQDYSRLKCFLEKCKANFLITII